MAYAFTMVKLVIKFFFVLSSQLVDMLEPFKELKTSSYLAYSRHFSGLGKRVVTKQKCIQRQEKYVHNIKYLTYTSKQLDNEYIFVPCNLRDFKYMALINSYCSVYAFIEDTFVQVY